MSNRSPSDAYTSCYSVVIPVFNEEQVLHELYARLTEVMAEAYPSYEIIFINDGSKDNSLQIMKDLNRMNHRVKIVNLSRNFGHQIATSAGIDYSKGDAVIIMDADLQDPPEVIPRLIDKWKEGYEVVYGVRQHRKEGFVKRIAYASFYRLLRNISDINIPIDSGDFCIIDKKVIKILKNMPERNRFIRGIRSWVGFRQTGLRYNRDRRYAGDVKYTFAKLVKLALDGLINFSHKPLQLSSYLGFFVSFISFLGILVIFYLKLFTDITPVGFSTIVVLILFLGGIQLITVGIIGEYIGRIHDEVRQRPQYITNETVGFDDQDTSAKKET